MTARPKSDPPRDRPRVMGAAEIQASALMARQQYIYGEKEADSSSGLHAPVISPGLAAAAYTWNNTSARTCHAGRRICGLFPLRSLLKSDGQIFTASHNRGFHACVFCGFLSLNRQQRQGLSVHRWKRQYVTTRCRQGMRTDKRPAQRQQAD